MWLTISKLFANKTLKRTERITKTHNAVIIVNIATVYVAQETNYIDGRGKAKLI